MTASARRPAAPTSLLLRSTALLVALGSAAACTAILKPKDDVQRCGTATECSPTGDNRYVPVCKFDDEHIDLDSTKIDKICVADYKPVTCDPMSYASGPSAKNGFFDLAGKDSCVSLACTEENRGQAGCPPPSGEGCANGLELVQFGSSSYCIDPDADQPMIPGATLSDDTDGQHIRDQFCKSYFCDDTFVCNKSFKCQPCDPDRDFGDGGCGIVYNDGAPAAAYVLGDALTGDCLGEDATVDEFLHGDC